MSDLRKKILSPGNDSHVLNYVQFLNQRQLQPRSKETYIRVIKQFFHEFDSWDEQSMNSFLLKHPRQYYRGALVYFNDMIKTDFKIQKIREPARKLKPVPTKEELFAILEKIKHSNDNVYYTLKTAFITGSRIAEVLMLHMRDFRPDGIEFPTTKTGVPRKVLIPKNQIDEIIRYSKEEMGNLAIDRVFFPRVNKPFTAYVILRRYIDKTPVISNEEKETLKRTHNFRRGMVNEILELTENDLISASAYMGMDIKTIMRYVSELTRERGKQKAYEVLNKKWGTGA